MVKGDCLVLFSCTALIYFGSQALAEVKDDKEITGSAGASGAAKIQCFLKRPGPAQSYDAQHGRPVPRLIGISHITISVTAVILILLKYNFCVWRSAITIKLY